MTGDAEQSQAKTFPGPHKSLKICGQAFFILVYLPSLQ